MTCLCYCCITALRCHSGAANSFEGSLSLMNLIVALVSAQPFKARAGASFVAKSQYFGSKHHHTSHAHQWLECALSDCVRSVSKHAAIVTARTIGPNGPMLYSGSLWIALQPLISLFTSWTAHTQTGKQRQWILGSAFGAEGPRPPLKSNTGLLSCGEKARMGRLIIPTKMLWPPSICLRFRKSKPPVSLFAMRKSLRSSHMRCPESAPSVPIVMVINLLAPLFRARRGGVRRSQGSHYHATTPDKQTRLHSAGETRHFLWAIVILSPYC